MCRSSPGWSLLCLILLPQLTTAIMDLRIAVRPVNHTSLRIRTEFTMEFDRVAPAPASATTAEMAIEGTVTLFRRTDSDAPSRLRR